MSYTLHRENLNQNRGNHGFFVHRQNLIAFVFAAVCAIAFTSLPVDIFPDRQNYFGYASHRSLPLLEFYWSQGLISFLLNEPIWLLLNIGLSRIFEPETIVRAIIFVQVFVIYFLGIKKTGPWFLLFILFSLHPIFSTNHIHHLRFGLALSLFTIGYYSNRVYMHYLLLLVASMVHVAFFALILIYASSILAVRFRQKNIAAPFLTLLLGMLFLIALDLFLGTARQVERYLDQSVEVGGGLFLLTLSIFSLFIVQKGNFIREHIFAISALGFYLTLYWVFPYPRRFLDGAIFFILVAGLNLRGMSKLLFLSIMSILLIHFLAGNWNQPYLGMALDR